jgi:ATP-dependent Clp protease ATP-binding subunit ClpB
VLIERLSVATQSATELAGRIAVKANHKHVTPAHVLLALVEPKGAALVRHLEAAGTDVGKLTELTRKRFGGIARADAAAEHTPINRALEAVLIRAEEHAQRLGQRYIGPPHVLAGLLQDEECAADLAGAGLDATKLKVALDAARGTQGRGATDLAAYESLAKFGVDMTARARDGALDPVIGRDGEIRQVVQVLSRRMKNNPVLVGEPGVGKTAVIEGLAQRIVQGRVPDELKDHLVVSLDLGALLAGTKFRGEFEERLKRVLDDVTEAGNVVLFIDEMHMLMGAGGAEGGTDASNLLKPALSRGELRVIGSTTLTEYRKRIEKDAAFSRRFQLVTVDEPTPEQALTILRGLKEKYEGHHGVRITDPALAAAVRLSHRYVTDRFLPDKAIDAIDQAAAGLRMESASRPEEIEKLDEKIVGLEVEVRAVLQDAGGQGNETTKKLHADIEVAKAERGKLLERWEAEKRSVLGAQEARRELEAARHEMETKIREEDFARVAELQYKVIPERERRVAELGEIDVTEVRFVRKEVTEKDVAEAIGKMTRIPVAKMLEEEMDRLLKMEEVLGARVVGQEDAVRVVARAVRRARAGVQDPNRPLGSFLLLGPTGVGKTELAKALAEFLFDDERALVRIDMSEFMERQSAARLVGAPPGYVGYEEGGVLTNAVKRRPYSVILLDEVEKAHQDVFNILLQLLDDGRLTDSQGTVVNFKNTIVLMTSNLGGSAGDPSEDALTTSKRMKEAAKKFFRPELLNRLDDQLVFRPLTMDIMRPIAELQIGRLAKLLLERSITLDVTAEAVAYLADKGFEPAFGARPLRRVIQTDLQDPIADMLLGRTVANGQTVRVGIEDGKLAFGAS